MIRIGYSLVLALTVAVAGCEPDRPIPPPKHTVGHKVYYGYCSGCHDSGSEKVPSLHETPYLQKNSSDADWLISVRLGKGQMPPQGGMLKDDDIKAAIGYIRFMQQQGQKNKMKSD